MCQEAVRLSSFILFELSLLKTSEKSLSVLLSNQVSVLQIFVISLVSFHSFQVRVTLGLKLHSIRKSSLVNGLNMLNEGIQSEIIKKVTLLLMMSFVYPRCR